MKYLLDTHTLLWYIDNNTLLPKRAEDIIDNLDNTIYVSVVSLWEIAIKINIKKLTLDFNFDSMISILKSKEFKIYPIKNKNL
jgi:PIN domain nuclease of toxin-antitoxin system